MDEYTFVLKLSFSVSESSANQTIIIFATPENISVAENDIDVQTAPVAASPIGGGY